MRSTSGLLDEQKAKVMAQREKVEKLKLLQDNINLLREQYNKAAGRAGELRQEAEVVEAGVTPLGSALTPQEPVFPNKALVFAGALAGGLGGGVVLSLLLEFLARRVRGAEDLESLVDAPMLAVIRRTPQKKVRTSRWIGGRNRVPALERA
jgi:capsular polysaccharide biosynthesis protein